jgi:hypothetical protein
MMAVLRAKNTAGMRRVVVSAQRGIQVKRKASAGATHLRIPSGLKAREKTARRQPG